MFIIQKGMVRIFKKKGDGDIELDVIRTGQIFGELAFLDGNPRSASAEAMTDVVLNEISGPTFEKTLMSMPEWLKILLKAVVGRLRAASTKIRQLESSSTAIDYSKDGKRVTVSVFLSVIDFMKIGTSVLLVGSRNPAREIKMSTLEKYASQIIGVPAAKIAATLDLLQQAGIVTMVDEVDGTKTILNDPDFLEKLLSYLNEENLAEQSKKHSVTPKAFFVMSLIMKYLDEYPPNAEGISQVNLGRIQEAEAGPTGKSLFKLQDLDELVTLKYITVPNMKSAKEIFTDIKTDFFRKSYRFQRIAMCIQALNEKKKKISR